MKKRMIAVLLSVVMLSTTAVANLIPSAMALGDTQAPVIVTADSGNNTISIVTRDNSTPTSELQVHSASFSIKRDYNQNAYVAIHNYSEENLQYYLAVENRYTDIHLNFTKSGSVDDPLVIKAEEEQTVEMTIFAQNTARATYDIRVTAYIIGDKEERLASTGTVTLNVAQSPFDVSITSGASDQYSLAQTFTISEQSC